MSFAGDAKTIALAEYLDLANRSGFNIIYSSDLLPRRYSVTHDESVKPSLDSLTKALEFYGLALRRVSSDSFNVVLKEQKEIVLSQRVSEINSPPEISSLEEVVVSSSVYKLYMAEAGSLHVLDAETLSARALTANDVTRVVNQLPGSASVGVSARPRVRGGNENETLFLFDGVRLYNPFHFNRFNSLFSSFDNRVVSELEFYSGGYPVSLGDRMSGAMLLEAKDPQELGDYREVGAGLYHSSYLQNSTNDKHSILFSARRSNFEALNKVAENDFGTPVFGDVFMRYQRELNDVSQLDISLLYFGDDLEINNSSNSESSESHDNSVYLWAKLQDRAATDLDRTSRFGFAQSLNDRKGDVNNPGQVVGDIHDELTFRLLFLSQSYEKLSDYGLLNFGWDYRYQIADYEYQSNQIVNPQFSGLTNIVRATNEERETQVRGHQGATYISLKQRIFNAMTIEAGLRLDVQHYESSLVDHQVSFRSGILYEATKNLGLRFSFGRYFQAQGVHELDFADGETQFQPVQRADHFILGVDYAIPLVEANVKLEIYNKDASAARPYFQNLANPYTLIPELQVDRFQVDSQGYSARGVELSIDGRLWEGEWWLNLSYSSAKDELVGKDLSRSWDQARSANAGYHRKFGRWQWSVSASFHEGWLTTPLLQVGGVVVSGERNSTRFDHFYSVDFKSSRTWLLSDSQLRLEFGATNTLGRENQIGVNFESDFGALVTVPEEGLPLAPFVDLFWRF